MRKSSGGFSTTTANSEKKYHTHPEDIYILIFHLHFWLNIDNMTRQSHHKTIGYINRFGLEVRHCTFECTYNMSR